MLDYQSKLSQFKEEIVKLDKENVNLDDRLIEKEREVERLRGELSVMERMFGNLGGGASRGNNFDRSPNSGPVDQKMKFRGTRGEQGSDGQRNFRSGRGARTDRFRDLSMGMN